MKYARSASSCSRSTYFVRVVERLMFTIGNPCSIAQPKAVQHPPRCGPRPGAEHADAPQLRRPAPPPHPTPGARRALPAEVAPSSSTTWSAPASSRTTATDRSNAAHERMVDLDPAVQDADADACAGRAVPGPLPRHLLGQIHRHADPVDRLRGKARGRELLLFVVLVQFDGESRSSTPFIRISAEISTGVPSGTVRISQRTSPPSRAGTRPRRPSPAPSRSGWRRSR